MTGCWKDGRGLALRQTVAIASSLVVFSLSAGPALASVGTALPGTTPLDGYVTNGTVNSVVQSSSVTYLGGQFSEVGPRTGSFAGVSASTATYEAQLAPEVYGSVDAIAPDGSGGWYIGGAFSAVGGVAIQNVAHITSSGTLDTSWTPNPNAQINAIAVSPDGSTVYLGGQFTSAGGSTRGSVAAVSASTGAATSWNPNTTGVVNAIAVSPDGATVYLGGSGLAGACGSYVYACALSSSTGADVSGWTPGLSGGAVNAIAVTGGTSGTVYLGGNFTAAGADTREGAAAVGAVGTAESGVLSVWDPISSFGEINALVLSPSDSTVYLGGDGMSGISGYSGTVDAAAVSASSGAGTGWNPGPNGDVLSLGVSPDGSTVYLGGNFSTVDSGASTTVARDDAAAVSSSTGYDTGWNAAPDAQVYAIGTSSSSVMLGGYFDTVNEQSRENLAALTTATGDITSWNPGASVVSGTALVDTLALSADDSTLYVGGTFTELGGAGQIDAGAVSTSTGANTGWDPGLPNGGVSAIAVGSSYVYVAGGFTVENSDTGNAVYVDGLDAFSPSGVSGAGTAVSGWDSGVGGGVETMAVSGSVLYIGGYFTSAGSPSATRNHIAAVDASTGALESWNPDANNDVNTLAISPDGSTVYLGGSFSEIGTTARSFAGAVSASTGDVTSWNPSPNGGVTTIAPAPNGTVVYLGGTFNSVSASGGGTVTRSDAAAVDTGAGYDLGWDPQVNGVYSIAASSTTIAVGGQGAAVGNIPQANIALFAPSPTAAFSWQQASGSLGVQFTDTSTAVSPATITGWSWNFGDGSSSTAENPDHTYAAPGPYDVTLTVTDSNGEQDSATLAVQVTGVAGPPTASFTSAQALSSLAVQFTDTSTAVSPATVTGWSWDFGDGSAMSTSEDPDHTYTAAGHYSVTLTVTDSNGEQDSDMVTVDVLSLPTASFTSSQSLSSLAVQFTDTSTAVSPATVTGWLWHFGDGSSSTAENPDHTYAASGHYSVTLTVTGSNGEQDSDTVTVDVLSLPTASFTSAQNPSSLAVQFTDASMAVSPATITGWSWNFGDGSALSTAQDPDHTYATTGTYQVSLTVTDSNGRQAVSQQSVVVSAVAGSGSGGSGSGTGGTGSGGSGSGSSGSGGTGSGSGGSGTGSGGSGSGGTGSGSSGSGSTGSGGSGGGAGSAGSGSPSPTPTPGQIQKLLMGTLTPSGAHLSASAILSAGSFTTSFTPPAPGKLVVDWYAKVGGGSLGHRARAKAKLVLVASCQQTFSSDKKGSVKIKLTSAGRKLLHGAKRIALTADDNFTPKGKKAIKTSKQFTLKGGRK